MPNYGKSRPTYVTDLLIAKVSSDGRPPSLKYAEELGISYKKLLGIYRWLGLPTVVVRQQNKARDLQLCRQALRANPHARVCDLAKLTGRHPVSLSELLRTERLREFTPQLKPQEVAECTSLISTTYGRQTRAEILEATGLSVSQYNRLRSNLNLPARGTAAYAQRSSWVNSFFFKDWASSVDVAYVLGLLWADGCLHIRDHKHPRANPQATLSLGLVDGDMVRKVGSLMGSKYQLYVTEKNRYPKVINGVNVKESKETTLLAIPNRQIADDLLALGFSPRKSQAACLPPYNSSHTEDLRRAFMRGYFDGDGWQCATPFGPYRIGAVFTSVEQAEACLCLLPPPFNVRKVYQRQPMICVVNWNMQPALELAHWLYKDSDLHLKRKYTKYRLACMKYDQVPVTMKVGF